MSGPTPAHFVVLACPCGEPWATESRHAKATCPRCGKEAELAGRKRLWEGDDARAAREAAAQARAAAAGADLRLLVAAPREARHDSPEDAAAAQARALTNKSDRAEAVALWLTRLVGQPSHSQLVDALGRAGLDRVRAEREVMRMLAMDYIMEPRAGYYRVIEA